MALNLFLVVAIANSIFIILYILLSTTNRKESADTCSTESLSNDENNSSKSDQNETSTEQRDYSDNDNQQNLSFSQENNNEMEENQIEDPITNEADEYVVSSNENNSHEPVSNLPSIYPISEPSLDASIIESSTESMTSSSSPIVSDVSTPMKKPSIVIDTTDALAFDLLKFSSNLRHPGVDVTYWKHGERKPKVLKLNDKGELRWKSSYKTLCPLMKIKSVVLDQSHSSIIIDHGLGHLQFSLSSAEENKAFVKGFNALRSQAAYDPTYLHHLKEKNGSENINGVNSPETIASQSTLSTPASQLHTPASTFSHVPLGEYVTSTPITMANKYSQMSVRELKHEMDVLGYAKVSSVFTEKSEFVNFLLKLNNEAHQ